jgi:hypothetical protein
LYKYTFGATRIEKGTKTAKECDITQLSLLFITVVSTAVALCIKGLPCNRTGTHTTLCSTKTMAMVQNELSGKLRHEERNNIHYMSI